MIPVQPTPQPLPPGFQAPSTTQSMLEMLAKYTKCQIQNDSQVMVVSSNTPAVVDQNKAWLRTDTYGRPVGFFLWYKPSTAGAVGSWRRVPTPRPAEIRMFNGLPTQYFDASGRGLTTGAWDGWALCNGGNGTVNLRDRFIVPTPVAAQQLVTGGAASLLLHYYNIPRITGAIGELYDFKTGGGLPGFSGLITKGGARQSVTVFADGTPQANFADGIAIPSLPPYVAVGFAQWVGYQ